MLRKLYYPVKSLSFSPEKLCYYQFESTDYEVSSLEKVLRLKNPKKGWRGASG